MIFGDPEHSSNGAASVLNLGPFNLPLGVTVSPTAGDFWVADANAEQLLHFPPFDTLILNGGGQLNDQAIPSPTPAAVAFDSFGNLISAELINRVSFYFSILAFRNTANFNSQPVAPGSLTYVGRPGVDFSFTPASVSTTPWPTTLGNLNVVVNGTMAPIYLVTSNAVFFQVPSNAPTSGFADIQVIDSVTGQIYAYSEMPMAAANPGFYTINSQGTGQAAARNLVDNSINGPSNPVQADGKHYIQFYLTGLGRNPGRSTRWPGATEPCCGSDERAIHLRRSKLRNRRRRLRLVGFVLGTRGVPGRLGHQPFGAERGSGRRMQ